MAIFFNSSVKSQDYVIMTDVSGLTLVPLLTKKLDSPKALYYFDLQFEWAFSLDASLIFRTAYGRNGVIDSYHNDELNHRIIENSIVLAVEYRQYFSKKKDSPFGFYNGYLYRHSFLLDKYYDYVQDQFQFTEPDKGNTFSVGYKIGYKFGNKVVIDPSIGIGFAYTSGMDRLGEIIQFKDIYRRFSFPVELKLSIGYAF